MNISTGTSNFTKELTDFGLQYYCSLAVEQVLVGWHNIDMYMRVGGKMDRRLYKQTGRAGRQAVVVRLKETNKQPDGITK